MLRGLEGGRPVGGGALGRVSGAPCAEVTKLLGPPSRLELGSHPAAPRALRGACHRRSSRKLTEGLNGQLSGRRTPAKEGR